MLGKENLKSLNLQNFVFCAIVGYQSCFERQRVAIPIAKRPDSPLTDAKASDGIVT